MAGRRFVFVDRDGTVIEDPGFVHRIEDYAPLPGAAEALRRLQGAGFAIAIVTNQSGIGRGLFSEAEFQTFQSHLIQDLSNRGVRIEATYHCPHRPDEGCDCRKPGTALLRRAEQELEARLEESFVIGDKPEDIEMALRAGCRPVYVLTGHGAERRAELEPDVPVVGDLPEAVDRILTETNARRPSG
jgi:D-glycero-D-manno-heptose 1,7-bisphosphate phosphatase